MHDVRQLITVCRYLQGSAKFGMLECEQFSQDKINTWIKDIKQNTKDKVVARLIRPSFVGVPTTFFNFLTAHMQDKLN